jgi:hypothetical protein
MRAKRKKETYAKHESVAKWSRPKENLTNNFLNPLIAKNNKSDGVSQRPWIQ